MVNSTYNYKWILRGADMMSLRRPDLYPSPTKAELQLLIWMKTLRDNPDTAYISAGGFMLGISTDEDGDSCFELTQHLVDWYDFDGIDDLEDALTGYDWISPLDRHDLL